ncbi:MAG: Demethylmenaquinone methyltransferase [Chlamydiae bacterium]|nr:Demethylmenaquinone methyltransferase [Chlamydiota bacterium]
MAHMNEKASQEQVSQMFNAISFSYDRINRVLSFGIDRLWRRKLSKHLPDGNHLRLLDLATGTCDQLLSLMRTGKIAHATGIDLAQEMLKIGEQKVSKSSYGEKVDLKVASASDIPAEEGSYDCVTISFGIRNVKGPCLEEMHRVLSPGGRALILEFSLPKNRLIKWLHLFYLRKVLPAVGGAISGKRDAYRYLNETIEAFPYGEAFLSRMKKAGFVHLRALPLTFGVANIYIGEKE